MRVTQKVKMGCPFLCTLHSPPHLPYTSMFPKMAFGLASKLPTPPQDILWLFAVAVRCNMVC